MARSPTARDQQRLTSMPSRRDCHPVSHDALWIRLNVAEPPRLNLPSPSTGLRPSKISSPKRRPTQRSLTSQVVTDADGMLRSRAVHGSSRARRDADGTVGSGDIKARRRAKMTSTSVPPPLTTTTRRKLGTETVNRRRVMVAVNVSDNFAVTQTTMTTTSPLSSMRSRSMQKSRSTTPPYATLARSAPKVDRTTRSPLEVETAALNDDDEDAMAAVFRQTSWQCQAEPYWRRMPTGTFPPYVQTARCRQSRCMLGLYECVPKRYGIKVLRRVDDRCLPVPLVASVSANTTTRGGNGDRIPSVSAAGGLFEQAWTFVETNVVVGCECARRRNTGSYYHLPESLAP
jgi:hypothetical protein